MTRPRRRLALIAAAVLACSAVSTTSPATASENDRLLVDVADGQGFTSHPHGPLLDTRGLAPGLSASATMGVQNVSGERGTLTLSVENVVDNDNGCNRPEARIDSGCGAGDGELSDQLVLRVATSARAKGGFVSLWQGSLDRLATGVEVHRPLAAAETRWLLITAMLPPGSGNETQSDLVGFDVGVTLSLVTGGTTVQVQGSKAASQSSGTGAALGRLGALPATGASVLISVLVGLCLVLAGLALRRSRSPRSGLTPHRIPGPRHARRFAR